MNARPETKHAPAERAAPETIATQAQRFRQATLLRALAGAIPDILVILNPQRQIVYANQRLIELLGLEDSQEILGLRPGEALECVHASQTQAGCGTTEFCRQCGAVNAILLRQRGQPARGQNAAGPVPETHKRRYRSTQCDRAIPPLARRSSIRSPPWLIPPCLRLGQLPWSPAHSGEHRIVHHRVV